MLDTIYQVLLTIINKEQQGYVSPTEFNLLAHNVQQEIFRGYFDDINLDVNRANKGMVNRGYANLPFNERQRIDQFASIATINQSGGAFPLPEDIYFIEDDGVLTGTGQTYPNRVIDEVERRSTGYVNLSLSAPTPLYPTYERREDSIIVTPSSITQVIMRYIRTPKFPNWTYFVLPNAEPAFNAADVSYQDFELHPSEFSNIVLRMLSSFGLNLREADVVKVAEALKDKMTIKESN